MPFRSDEISIHLLPAGDKDKDKEKEKEKEKGNKDGPRPDPDQDLEWGGGCKATCTAGTGFGTGKEAMSGGVAQDIAFLRARLREALAPPPV